MGVIAEMSFLLFGLLLLHLLSNCVNAKQIELEEDLGGDLEETMYKSQLNGHEMKVEELLQRMERMEISWKLDKAHLENKLESQNMELEKHQKQLEEMKVQCGYSHKKATDLQNEFAKMESKMKAVMLNIQEKHQNQEVSGLKSEVRAEVKKEEEKVLPTSVEQGLRDLPFEMVCAFKREWYAEGVVTYDQISVEFNNSDRPGGAD